MKFIIIIGDHSSFQKKVISNSLRKNYKKEVFGMNFVKDLTLEEALEEATQNANVEPEVDKLLETVFVVDNHELLYEQLLNHNLEVESTRKILASIEQKKNKNFSKGLTSNIEKTVKRFNPKFKRPSLSYALSR